MKLLFTTLFSLFIFTISGQSIVYFEGIVIEDKSKDPVPDVVIVNVRNESSWVSDINGFFSLEAKAGDTLVFSKPGFSYRYASAKNDDSVVIALLPQNYLLDEVPITAYKLTSNLPKQIPLNKPNRPTGDDISTPTRIKPTLANPIDFLYDRFGKRPRQLRELKAILENENYRAKLAENNNRDALFELTGLTKDKIEELLLFCSWDKHKIHYETDYQLLLSLYTCYENYQKRQNLETP